MVAYPWPDKSANKAHDEQVGDQMKVRMARAKIAPAGLIAVALALTSAAVGLVAAPAGAAPSTKSYTLTANPTATDVSSDPVSVTFTLLNCDSSCSKKSTQSIGSANVTLPHGWTWDTSWDTGATISGLVVQSTADKTSHWKSVSGTTTDASGDTIIELRNDGSNTTDALAPGESLTFSVMLTPTPAGLAQIVSEIKQSNDFSGTGNDFLLSSGTTDPTIVIGPPDHLEFGVPPQTVQQTTTTNGTTTYYYMCDGSNHGPTVRVVDRLGNTVSWTSGTVTLVNESATNPGLSYASGSPLTHSATLQETIHSGVATFGGDCTSGLSATTLGTFVLGATASVTGVGALSMPTAKQKTYAVLQYYQICGASCPTVTIKGAHTSAGASGSDGVTGSTDRLGISVGVYGDLGGCQPEADNPNRSVVSVDLNNHKKQVTLSWDKQTVQIFTNNGTPFWNVCIWTTYPFTVAGGAAAATVTGPPDNTTWYTGFVANCTDVDPAANPCISNLYRRGGAEFADISLPNVTGDPHFI
jgi:hypothetical protein